MEMVKEGMRTIFLYSVDTLHKIIKGDVKKNPFKDRYPDFQKLLMQENIVLSPLVLGIYQKTYITRELDEGILETYLEDDLENSGYENLLGEDEAHRELIQIVYDDLLWVQESLITKELGESKKRIMTYPLKSKIPKVNEKDPSIIINHSDQMKIEFLQCFKGKIDLEGLVKLKKNHEKHKKRMVNELSHYGMTFFEYALLN